ncbi:hypothetical protein F5B20DRAFT_546757 [Whalleya microplaca]|nr:hypothetical protein F5B20DRAFT_546757 [Whalleya microplaca]
MKEFGQLHDKYLEWLDEQQSPFSTEVWFGEYEGYEIRKIPPRRWRWLKANCDKWNGILQEIEDRYEVWKEKHPRRACASRAKPVIVNPVGEKLGRADDWPPSDNDMSYESDDGFVVDSSDEDGDYDPEGSYEPVAETEDEDMLGNDGSEEKPRSPTGSDIESNYSLPSLNEVIQSARVKKGTGSRLRTMPEVNQLSGSDDGHDGSECSSDSDVIIRNRQHLRRK